MSDPTQVEPHTEVDFQLEPQDLEHAQRLHFRQELGSRRGFVRNALLWIISVAAVGMIWIGLGSLNDAVLPTLVFALAAPFAIVGLPFLMVYALSGNSARKIFAEQKTLQKPIRLSWTKGGVMFESNFGEARLQWGDFVKSRQDRHIVLLYESSRLYRMIPKRVLTGEQISNLNSKIDGIRVNQANPDALR